MGDGGARICSSAVFCWAQIGHGTSMSYSLPLPFQTWVGLSTPLLTVLGLTRILNPAHNFAFEPSLLNCNTTTLPLPQ